MVAHFSAVSWPLQPSQFAGAYPGVEPKAYVIGHLARVNLVKTPSDEIGLVAAEGIRRVLLMRHRLDVAHRVVRDQAVLRCQAQRFHNTEACLLRVLPDKLWLAAIWKHCQGRRHRHAIRH